MLLDASPAGFAMAQAKASQAKIRGCLPGCAAFRGVGKRALPVQAACAAVVGPERVQAFLPAARPAG